jgi:hypothetical protein
MNLLLNMKDINKILAKTLQMQILKKKKMWKKKHIFAKTCLYDAVGSLPVMPSLLPHGLWGRSQVSLIFASVLSPDLDTKQSKGTALLLLLYISVTVGFEQLIP